MLECAANKSIKRGYLYTFKLHRETAQRKEFSRMHRQIHAALEFI
jgi:hypothetical protein